MKIGIIGAMELEVELLCEALQQRKDTQIRNFTFYQGYINTTEVVVLLSGIGKVSAAVGTTLLIEQFQPDLVINTGVAGGLSQSQVYDIVLASELCYHDVDVTAFGYKLGQQAQMPLLYKPDAFWTEKARTICEQHTNNLHIGQIVSGDSFVNTTERKQWIEEQFPKAIAVEMESAAIAQACFLMQTPFLIIRSISDNASEGNTVSYDTFVNKAGRLSAQININFIKSLP